MNKLTSVSKPKPKLSALKTARGLEAEAPRITTPGSQGRESEPSRSLKYLAVKGKSDPLSRLRMAGHTLKSVIGPTDDRVRILDTDLAPWRMICALSIRATTASSLIGTGWFVGPKTIVTAGHCVFSNQLLDGWASSIEISPGRNGSEFPYGTVTSEKFTSVDRWVNDEDPDFDIGCIHLSEPLGERAGWFSVGALSPAELEGYLVNISGYPGDRGMRTEQYHHKNRVLRVTDRRIFYDVDTYGGQSGAPVWIHVSDDSPPIAIGIHAYGTGGSPVGLEANSAPRIIPEVLEQIQKWVEEDGGWPSAL